MHVEQIKHRRKVYHAPIFDTFTDLKPPEPVDEPCKSCPFDKGTGLYCLGHCLKEIQDEKKGG